MQPKPIASFSLDLDNEWSYLKIHGDPGWDRFPTYLPVVVPRVLRILSERNLRITFFVVGQDAVFADNHEALRSIARCGHEIGNHTFSHEPWLQLYSRGTLEKEITSAEELIESVTGVKTIGFRAPGFSICGEVLQILRQRNYLYDASSFPTWVGPLARAYYLWTSNLGPSELKERGALFGSFKDILRPLRPFYCSVDGPLLEIPVTTMPLFRIPIHASYILYLATFSRLLAIAYLRLALFLCLSKGIAPSFLLHPLDLLGPEDAPRLRFFPAMKLPSEEKIQFVSELLDIFSSYFKIVTLKEHAKLTSCLPTPTKGKSPISITHTFPGTD